MLGTHLAAPGRARLAWAAVLVGTAVAVLLAAIGLMVLNESVNQELMIQGAAALVIIGLAATVAVQAYRRIAPSSARPALGTTIAVWVVVVAAFAAFTPMRALGDLPAVIAVLWLPATLSLLLPLPAPGRVAIGGVVLGAMASIVLYVGRSGATNRCRAGGCRIPGHCRGRGGSPAPGLLQPARSIATARRGPDGPIRRSGRWRRPAPPRSRARSRRGRRRGTSWKSACGQAWCRSYAVTAGVATS